ncbi:MAG: PD-(D/E)XK nuclease family protein [Deltaproteobacteria bacterium]|nr:PD-(D/E)XK nuclease family protein [Deltaproteobacteria bacterium]
MTDLNQTLPLCRVADDGALHMRQTFVGLALRCPAAAGCYLTHGPRPPGLAAVVGQGAHRAFEQGCRDLMSQRAEGWDKTPYLSGLIATAEDHLDRCLRSDVALDPDQPADRQIDKARDDLVATVRRFVSEVAPTLAPERVEWRVAIRVGQDVVSTALDLVQVGGVVEDFKTGRRTDDRSAHESRQLTAQALAYRLTEGRMPAGLGLRAVNPERSGSHWTTRTEADLRAYLDAVRQVAAMVRAGLFPPCGEGAWWCSAKWCGWHPGAGGPCRFGR